MSSCLSLISNIMLRESCGLNVLYSVGETYVANQSVIIDDSFNVVTYYNSFCLGQESEYSTFIRNAQPVYLSEALDFINAIETSDYCAEVFGNDSLTSNLTVEEC
jgi:phage repressor protein C with HTH and peptisase S24 domain